MDIELWLICTNRRGRGETKRGIVRLLKIHYMRGGEKSTDGEKERQRQKGAERYKEKKLSEGNIFHSYLPVFS